MPRVRLFTLKRISHLPLVPVRSTPMMPPFPITMIWRLAIGLCAGRVGEDAREGDDLLPFFTRFMLSGWVAVSFVVSNVIGAAA